VASGCIGISTNGEVLVNLTISNTPTILSILITMSSPSQISTIDSAPAFLIPKPLISSWGIIDSNDDYDIEWMRSAFDGDSQTSFAAGVMDVSKFGLEGRGAAIRWGVAVLSVWTFVVNGVEDAVAISKRGIFATRAPIATRGDSGYFLYSLAQTECGNFGTCKEGTTGLATVNGKMYESFRQGKQNLLQGECENAKATVERSRGLMTIPLI